MWCQHDAPCITVCPSEQRGEALHALWCALGQKLVHPAGVQVTEQGQTLELLQLKRGQRVQIGFEGVVDRPPKG